MTYATRLAALKARGFRFTVDARFNFRADKLFSVTTPEGATLAEEFSDIRDAIRFCEGL